MIEEEEKIAITHKYCIRFGKIAVQKGYVSEEKLIEAMKSQLEDDLHGRKHRLIGKVLIDLKYMDASQVEDVLNEIFKQ